MTVATLHPQSLGGRRPPEQMVSEEEQERLMKGLQEKKPRIAVLGLLQLSLPRGKELLRTSVLLEVDSALDRWGH